MKKILIPLVALSLCAWVSVSFVNTSFNDTKKNINFLDVNLVCGAAPNIGCGSRSRPILVDLEKEKSIEEAWLNRKGTVVAVVWEEATQPDINALTSIFKKHNKEFTVLEGKALKEQLKSFKTDKWYKGTDVNELSNEEAGVIASKLINPLVEDEILSKEDAPKLFKEVEAFIQNEFMVLEDVSLLKDRAYWQRWEKAFTEMGEKYVGKGNMPELQMCGPKSSCKKEKRCSSTKKSCCSKSKIN